MSCSENDSTNSGSSPSREAAFDEYGQFGYALEPEYTEEELHEMEAAERFITETHEHNEENKPVQTLRKRKPTKVPPTMIPDRPVPIQDYRQNESSDEESVELVIIHSDADDDSNPSVTDLTSQQGEQNEVLETEASGSDGDALSQADSVTTVDETDSEEEQRSALDSGNDIEQQENPPEDSSSSSSQTIRRSTRERRKPAWMRSENSGETYIRWGKTSCPEESYLVYDGYAAGKHNDIGGSGSNLLCLSKNPEWKDYTEEYNPWTGKIYGIEYEILQNKPYPKTFHDKNVPCAVCQSKRATVLIVLGKVTCHCGWHKEFSGYVMSQLNLNGLTPSEYICVDEKLESVPGGDANQNEAVVYPVVAVCGSLKCPPYVNGVELTCVVCSK
ncbi:unnamed protein product [Mytilus edulis]|uniref:Uncharacterized protein n=1 Tax=Mytilus edulis TaxID=6550 RepID=A0A8S3V5K9_MYTED|nr:unnamed protein product [Mytilus edulis]